ncbi:MAG: fatty acid desaturase [Gammaproteobacteria bacterium]
MSFGVFDASISEVIVYVLIITHITILSVTIYLHRFCAHRALTVHPILQHFFRFWLWLTTGMVTKAWTAIHRKHHAYCESNNDPHSPQVLSIRKVLLEGAELYQKESRKGTPDDWLERKLYSKYDKAGVSLMLIINIALLGPIGLTVWAIQMLWIPLLAAGVINGIGHYWGYRNFDCNDASRNIIPFGLLIGGEELHNNHHTYPNSAKLSVKPWELDIGWCYIKLFSYLGLAQVKRIAPLTRQISGKDTLDIDTVRALILNRFQILSDYCRQVIEPTINLEQRHASPESKTLLTTVKRMLSRENAAQASADTRERLEHLLVDFQTVAITYQFKWQLQAIAEHTSASKVELMNSLTEWCRQAERTGIKALQDFAIRLRQYSLISAS